MILITDATPFHDCCEQAKIADAKWRHAKETHHAVVRGIGKHLRQHLLADTTGLFIKALSSQCHIRRGIPGVNVITNMGLHQIVAMNTIMVDLGWTVEDRRDNVRGGRATEVTFISNQI